jgi:hypothetical protein
MSCLDKLKEYCGNNRNTNIYAYYPSGTVHFFKVKPSFAAQPNVNKPTLEEMEKDENYICSISINNIANDFLSHRITLLGDILGGKKSKAKRYPLFHKSKSRGVKFFPELIYLDYKLYLREELIADYSIRDEKCLSILNFERGSKGDFLRIDVRYEPLGGNRHYHYITVTGNPTVILKKKRYLNPIDRFLLNKLNIIDL